MFKIVLELLLHLTTHKMPSIFQYSTFVKPFRMLKYADLESKTHSFLWKSEKEDPINSEDSQKVTNR